MASTGEGEPEISNTASYGPYGPHSSTGMPDTFWDSILCGSGKARDLECVPCMPGLPVQLHYLILWLWESVRSRFKSQDGHLLLCDSGQVIQHL